MFTALLMRRTLLPIDFLHCAMVCGFQCAVEHAVFYSWRALSRLGFPTAGVRAADARAAGLPGTAAEGSVSASTGIQLIILLIFGALNKSGYISAADAWRSVDRRQTAERAKLSSRGGELQR